ncbi:unnamed protein product [Linum trigynum]|uniref:Uncharacterized protein n=1 Tax=Linum trigynum TaxID=586398 RepID=A0AAV2C5Z1_9ROSI
MKREERRQIDNPCFRDEFCITSSELCFISLFSLLLVSIKRDWRSPLSLILVSVQGVLVEASAGDGAIVTAGQNPRHPTEMH